MKQTNKFKTALLVLFTIGIACMLLLTGCKDKTSEAYITNSDLPRTTYVQGQDLDLSDGILTVVQDGTESKVPLNAPEVTVTGYDKSTLGEQTLTVTHGDLTATFTVTVIPRITAEGFETSYFMGDEFNKNVGKLKVAGDDAKIVSVNMSDSRVSVVSFDSSVSGTVTVTVRYSDGTVSYDCQFDVTVYDTSNMQFTPPKVTKYSSHVKELNLTGGYFTVQTSDKKLEKKVSLTADMITGFNPDAATMAHRETPLSQTLTVEYLGKKFEFTITITFSGVSVVEYYVNGPLASLNLSGTLSETEKQNVLDATKEFYGLSKSNRALLAPATLEKIVAAGTLVVSDLFQQELKSCENTFTMTVEEDPDTNQKVGVLSLVGNSYAKAVVDIEKLSDDESNLNLYRNILAMLGEEYPTVRVKPGKPVSDYTAVYSDEGKAGMIEYLEHLIHCYDVLAVVPNNWTVSTLNQYGDAIKRIALEISMTDFYQSTGGLIYIDFLSPWRENNDFFEIIYSYFLYVYEEDDNFMATYLFQKMPMPGLLEEWYWCLQSAISTQSVLSQYYSDTKTDGMDLWEYMYEYHSLMKLAEEIENSGNQLWIDLYDAYGLKTLHKNYLYPYLLGSSHSQAMIDSENFDALWEAYYKLLVQIKTAGNGNIQLSVTDLLELYRCFETLTPAELHGFLCSISFKYSTLRGNKLMLYYDNETVHNVFTGLLKDGFAAYYLTDVTEPLFAKLLQAMEHYALLGYERNALNEFTRLMKEVIDGYGLLTGADLKNFDDYLITGFEKYQAIYLKVKGEATLDITAEERALLDALEAELRKYQKASEWATGNLTSAEFDVMMDAIYIKATSIYNTLLATAGEDALIELFTRKIVFANDEQDPDDDDVYYLEKWYYDIDKAHAYYLIGSVMPVADEGKVLYLTYWDAYEKYGLFDLYAKIADLLYFAYMDQTAAPDAEALAALATDIANMTDMQRYFFIGMYADSAYHWAKTAYLKSVLTDNTAADTAAGQIKDAAERYIEYRYYGDEDAKNAFVNAMAIAEASYAALSNEDKATLAEVYDYYHSLYLALTEAAA